MARFIPDHNSSFSDHFIDTESENTGTLYQRVVSVFVSNLRLREYAAEFGATDIVFYPVDEIYGINPSEPGLRKVLLSDTTTVGDIEIPSLHSRIVAVEERPGTGVFVACGHRGR